jgi:hypothetical protein
MTQTLVVLLSVTSVFAILLAAKSFLRIKICPLCAGVFLTWTALLAMSWLGYAVDRTIVAVLVGESVVGLYHLAEKKFKAEWGVFRLPFLLSLTLVAFLLLGADRRPLPAAAFLAILWLIPAAAYAWRHKPAGRELMKKLIACCRDW